MLDKQCSRKNLSFSNIVSFRESDSSLSSASISFIDSHPFMQIFSSRTNLLAIEDVNKYTNPSHWNIFNSFKLENYAEDCINFVEQ